MATPSLHDLLPPLTTALTLLLLSPLLLLLLKGLKIRGRSTWKMMNEENELDHKISAGNNLDKKFNNGLVLKQPLTVLITM